MCPGIRLRLATPLSEYTLALFDGGSVVALLAAAVELVAFLFVGYPFRKFFKELRKPNFHDPYDD